MNFKLIKPYWRVSLLKESPENTPFSILLLVSIGLLFFIVVVTQWSLIETEVPLTFAKTLLAAALLCLSYALYTYILLKVFKLEARYVQTLTSLFAVHTIIHVFAYPLIAATPLLTDGALPQSFAFLVVLAYLLLTLALTVWQLIVTVYIYKAALSVDNLAAILATIGLFASNILIVSLVR